MKKLVLASAAALVLAGATVSTGTVSAKTYAYRGYYYQYRTDKNSKLRYAKDNAKLRILNLLTEFKDVVGDNFSSYQKTFIYQIYQKRSVEDIEKSLDNFREVLEQLSENN
ncbi:hypothetical protein [Streptococcus equi]|uniref:hypothetical protein n=1 Tax=Streptococcus equi TaxID=1336 RepID=UPI001BB50756|nr:hypothetical protein [Streptococcus equi]MCD3384993.1 hypothetical protein [Streptococcus equi subsp. zooepidemicus]MCD3393372.1 hypothetical protein [Streptococcus equi subsp. zooepidemicus]QTR95019.1 hypothetical protein HCFMJIKG_00244 [Streptococcus equi subsp. zooepidemicus]HEK9982477.1 hypothetical protein [Streptococcus equi subsp. zooepidemicus]HEL0196939.1 hypothetical protein [Streptococcus equi subsp. zooepidemicus]